MPSSQAIQLTVKPAHPLIDEVPSIRVGKALAGGEVTVRVEVHDTNGALWRSETVFEADADGKVDVGKRAPKSGAYEGADPSGPWWSMDWVSDRSSSAWFPPCEDQLEFTVTAECEGQEAAASVIRTWQRGVTRKDVTGDGFVGVTFTPGNPNGAGIVVVGGSTGLAAVCPIASLLASHGYTTIAVGYIEAPGLPDSICEIPVEIFGDAASKLIDAGVNPARVGLLSYSMGTQGELSALALGAVQAAAAAAIAPSSCVWQAMPSHGRPPEKSQWTKGGEPLPWLKMQGESLLGQMVYNETVGRVTHRHQPRSLLTLIKAFEPGLEKNDEYERAEIHVEDIECPLLLAGGEDDQMWPSSEMINRMRARRAKAGKGEGDRYLSYPDAGHFLRPPLIPTMVGWTDAWVVGGTGVGTAKASSDVWRQLLEFFAANLAVPGE